MKTLILSLSFLIIASAVPAQTAFPSGPEFPAVHDAPFVLPVGSQQQPAVAFDGTNYLVVWVDSRGDKDAIMGARISQSGEVLDPVGFVISDPVTDARVTEPDVAWNGESFLVVWEYSFFTMVGRRVSPDGELIDPTVRTFFTGGYLVTPLVASNGDSFLVIDGGSPVRAGLLNRNGEFRPLETTSFKDLRGQTASVASDGSDYVIAVSGNSGGEIYTIPVAADGAVGPRQTVPNDLLNTGVSTQIVWSGTSYLATWIDRSPGDPNVSRDLTWGHYVSSSGGAEGTPFLIHDAPAGSYRYDACATGDEVSIAWNLFSFGQTGARLFRATVDGVTVSEPTEFDADRLSPSGIALACAGSEPFLFWSAGTTVATWELNFRPLGSPAEDAISVTKSVPRQTHTTSITTSRASLLLWQEETGGSSHIRVGTVGSNGSVARGSERAVAPSTVVQRYPRGATDGTNVLVVWTEEEPQFSRRLFGARVGLRGEELDSEPFLISDAVAGEGFFPDPENPPAIIWNGESYIAAWADAENRIRISRITRDGIVLDPGGVLVMESARGIEQGFPSMAVTDNGMTLLTWQDGRRPFVCLILCPPQPEARVVGALIAPGGTVASSAEIEISKDRPGIEPAVAWNGHHFLVIWKGVGIEGVRLTAEGQPLSASGDEILTLAEHRQPDALALIADGERFIAAWRETSSAWPVHGRILASSIDREGIVSGPTPVSPGIGNDRRPTILRTAAGGILFYYDRKVPESPYLEVRRIFGTGTTGFQVRRRPAR